MYVTGWLGHEHGLLVVTLMKHITVHTDTHTFYLCMIKLVCFTMTNAAAYWYFSHVHVRASTNLSLLFHRCTCSIITIVVDAGAIYICSVLTEMKYAVWCRFHSCLLAYNMYHMEIIIMSLLYWTHYIFLYFILSTLLCYFWFSSFSLPSHTTLLFLCCNVSNSPHFSVLRLFLIFLYLFFRHYNVIFCLHFLVAFTHSSIIVML